MNSTQSLPPKARNAWAELADDFAYEGAVLRERVHELEADNVWARAVVRQSVQMLHDLMRQLAQARETIVALRESQRLPAAANARRAA